MIRLFHGKSKYLSQQLAKSFLQQRQQELRDSNIPFDVITIDASQKTADQILLEMETPSLFSVHKILYVKRLSLNKEKDLMFQSIIGKSSSTATDTNTLILWEDTKLAKNLRIIKALAQQKAVFESPELDDPKKQNRRIFKTWAREAVLNADLRMSPDTISLLSDRSNYNTERFSGELAKLALLGKKTITESDIETYCPDTLEHTVWQLIDAINEGNAREAEGHLESMIRQGNDPHLILLMLARNVRLILLTKLLTEKGLNMYQIAQKVKAPPFTIATLQKSARSIPQERLATLYDKISNIDYSEKTGQLDLSLALHILISVI